MNSLEFVLTGLHNRHIRFQIDGRILQGVVVDDISVVDENTKTSHYKFIPTRNLKQWKEYEKIGDKEKMQALSSAIDIGKITWGEAI